MRSPSVLGLALAAILAGCGGTGSSAGGGDCVEVREPLDPLSIQHVIDPGDLTFLTNPPTSGPHIAGPAVTGRLDEPLVAAAQVRALEAGGVVIQYDAEADVDDGALDVLLDEIPTAAIAPGADLPSPIVATAWTWKLTCGSVDLDALRAFAAARPADAPGED